MFQKFKRLTKVFYTWKCKKNVTLQNDLENCVSENESG